MTDDNKAAPQAPKPEFLKLQAHHENLTKEFQMVTARHRAMTSEVMFLERVIHLSGAPHDFDRLADDYLDIAMDITRTESGALYFYDAKSEELYFASARGPKAQQVLDLDVTFKPGEGLVGTCFTELETITLSDVPTDERLLNDIAESIGYEVRSIMTTPIVHSGQALGAIQVINRRRHDHFSHEETDWFKRLGRYAGYSFALFLELQLNQPQEAAAPPPDKDDP